MASKKLTALEALELLKKLKKNNIDDQEVEDMLFDIIEETLKKHDFNPEHSYKKRQKASIKQMIAQADDRMVSRFHRGDFSPSLNIIASYKVSNKSLLEDYIENKGKRQMNIFEIKEKLEDDKR